MNSVNVATNLGFANPVTEYSIFEVAGPREQSGYLDAVAMSASEPAGLDNDGDGMPNSWENTYGSYNFV